MKEALQTQAESRLFLDEERSGVPLIDVLMAPAASVALMVGPEGGWADHERAEARDAGWTWIAMGNHILRAETAAISALAVVNAVLRR